MHQHGNLKQYTHCRICRKRSLQVTHVCLVLVCILDRKSITEHTSNLLLQGGQIYEHLSLKAATQYFNSQGVWLPRKSWRSFTTNPDFSNKYLQLWRHNKTQHCPPPAVIIALTTTWSGRVDDCYLTAPWRAFINFWGKTMPSYLSHLSSLGGRVRLVSTQSWEFQQVFSPWFVWMNKSLVRSKEAPSPRLPLLQLYTLSVGAGTKGIVPNYHGNHHCWLLSKAT